ncbi:hypothetical protein [Chitinivorax sp. B]|uniref:hypothetical protein n=1 Tax=Chitinivorax sp. B TaxID=2502235 RepID=UPI0010F78B1E|nr:hypothetical protein [Chitinivorax sp. B]
MKTAIVINLDYERFGYELCSQYWNQVTSVMEASGFILNNRMFLTNLSPEEAYNNARWVINQIDELTRHNSISLSQAIREFYGLDYTQVTNLLTPPTSTIAVEFIDNEFVSQSVN